MLSLRWRSEWNGLVRLSDSLLGSTLVKGKRKQVRASVQVTRDDELTKLSSPRALELGWPCTAAPVRGRRSQFRHPYPSASLGAVFLARGVTWNEVSHSPKKGENLYEGWRWAAFLAAGANHQSWRRLYAIGHSIHDNRKQQQLATE